MSGKKKKALVKPLPKYIRDELRMTCALKGYSLLKTGKAMRLPDQHAAMHKFYHGLTPSHPPQIKLLSDAHVNYSALYEEEEVLIKSKKKSQKATKASITRMKLKAMISNNSHASFYSGTDIRFSDLEKKNRIGKQLITGRNLHAMAIRGVRAYKKALAYSKDKWDMETLEPKKSGETIDDCIEYVRIKMFQDTKKTTSSDDESESEETPCVVPSVNDAIVEDEVEVEPEEKTVRAEVKNGTTNNDSDSGYSDDDNSESSSSDEDSKKMLAVPTDYLFPSFFVFVAYGPFVPSNQRLDMLLLDNRDKKKGVGTRAELRKKDANEKILESKHDTASQRGFSTEQCLEIESLDLQKQAMLERKTDSVLVGLSVEQSALKDQVEAAERRAASRCPEYNSTNVYWIKVDSLLDDQDKLLAKIRTFNTQLMKDKCMPKESVSSVLISPQKAKEHVELEVDDDVRTDDSSSTSSDVGEKRKKPSRVSHVVINK